MVEHATPDMTDDNTNALPPRDPIRQVATDAATDAVPLAVTGRPDFEAWTEAVDVVRGDLVATLESEVPA